MRAVALLIAETSQSWRRGRDSREPRVRRASEEKRENVQACLCVRVYVYARLRAAEPTCASDRDGQKEGERTEEGTTERIIE